MWSNLDLDLIVANYLLYVGLIVVITISKDQKTFYLVPLLNLGKNKV